MSWFTCPSCGHVHRPYGGILMGRRKALDPMPELDELLDDSDTTHLTCNGCGVALEVTTHATYTFEARAADTDGGG